MLRCSKSEILVMFVWKGPPAGADLGLASVALEASTYPDCMIAGSCDWSGYIIRFSVLSDTGSVLGNHSACRITHFRIRMLSPIEIQQAEKTREPRCSKGLGSEQPTQKVPMITATVV